MIYAPDGLCVPHCTNIFLALKFLNLFARKKIFSIFGAKEKLFCKFVLIDGDADDRKDKVPKIRLKD